MTADLPPLERLQAVTVHPDDVIIATSPRTITDHEYAGLRDLLKVTFPRNRVLVVSGGATIEVQRPAPQVDP